ncbi:MAG: LysM peptidoglycan-binding domain-containing protein [Candidatus Eisenbacteria bacterium]
MKLLIMGFACLLLLSAVTGCGTSRKLQDLPIGLSRTNGCEEEAWDTDSLPPMASFDEVVDSLLTEDSDWLLDSLSVPVGPLGTLDEAIADLPDISDSLAAETQAHLPSSEDLFDYPVVVNRRVLTWIDVFQGKARKNFERSLVRSGRYLAMARRIFREEGIPQDLVFIGHVESGFRYNALSSARALGLWQFMRGTARLYGLRCDGHVDERLDPEKSTRAAARYLKKLYGDFGDWYLAMAAYNAGEGKVARAIERCGTKDFWRLAGTKHLRNETRNFVPAILAATILAKSPGAYNLPEETDNPLAYDTVPVDSPLDLRVVASCTGVTVSELQHLNPALLLLQTPPDAKQWDVRVPVGLGETFAQKIAQIPAGERLVQHRHVVRSGETLGSLARRYGTTVAAIQDANRMGRKTMIRVGQTLSIPSRRGIAPEDLRASNSGDPVRHSVRRGETLSAIAKRYGVGIKDIQKANKLRNINSISPGQSLLIPVPAPRVDESTLAQAPAGESRVDGLPVSNSGPAAAVATPGSNDALARPASPPSRRMQELNTSYSLGRVSSTAHIVEQARQQMLEGELEEPPQQETAVVAEPPPVEHVVRRGETLSGIADRYGVSLSALKRWNSLRSSNLIRTGQKLKIVEPTRDAASKGDDSRVHVVRQGDSLWLIAKRYGVNARDLAARNGIGRSGRIYPGQKILVY